MKLVKSIVKQWMVAVLPIFSIVLCALTVFKEQVVASIASTPHPELVYIIWVAFGVGGIASYIALIRFTRERIWLNRGLGNLSSLKSAWVSDALPIYQILEGNYFILSSKRHAVLELELSALKTRFENRLTFANFIAGALVGLGLLGTFIGLLGAMGDLGKLFEVLGNAQDNINPVDLFTDMVKRLQEPMKGMGTAFVSSLYGLMGSIVISFLILVISKVEQGIFEQIHDLVRNNEYGINEITSETVKEQIDDGCSYEDISSLAMQLQDNTKHWQLAFSQMQQEHEKSLRETRVLRGEVLSVVSAIQDLSSVLRANMNSQNNQKEDYLWVENLQNSLHSIDNYIQQCKSSKTEQTLHGIERIAQTQLKALDGISNVLVSLEKRVDGHVSAFLKDSHESN